MFIESSDKTGADPEFPMIPISADTIPIRLMLERLLTKSFPLALSAPCTLKREHADSLALKVDTLIGQPPLTRLEGKGSAPSSPAKGALSRAELTRTVSVKDLDREQIYALLKEQLDLLHALASEKSAPHLEALIEKVVLKNRFPPDLQTLGKLAHLMEREQEAFEELLLEGTHEALLEWVQKRFQERIARSCAKIVTKAEAQRKFHETYGELYYYNALAVKIARLLITRSGALNVGLIPLVQCQCLEQKVEPSYARSIEHTLGLLLQDPSLRAKIGSIKKPVEGKKASNLVILSTLGKLRSDEVTERDAKIAALSSLLSHLRQGSKRSCFASYLAINLKNSYLDYCLDDIVALLKKSKLSRTINGISRLILFLPRIADPYHRIEFSLSRSGTVRTPEASAGKVWENEGMIRALKMLNYEDPVQTLKEYCKALPEKRMTTSFAKLMGHFATESASVEKERALENALFAFSASWTSTLMRSWVNAIAGMAESQANCYFSSSLIKAILSATRQEASAEIEERFEEALCRVLVERVRFLYDPTVLAEEEEAEGGFVLFETTLEQSKRSYRQIGSQQEFSAFITRCLEEAARRAGTEAAYSVSTKETRKHFLKYIGVSSERAEQKKIQPWVSPLGHDSLEIMKVYLERSEITESHVIIPTSAENLLFQLIRLLKTLPQHEKLLLESKPDSLRPVRIVNYHAFCLMPCHPSWHEAWKSAHPTRGWVEKELIKPSKRFSRNALDNETQQKVLSSLGLAAESKERIGYAAFRAALLEKRPAQEVDKALFAALPDVRRALAERALHFADTNLQSGLKDLHFCFIYNPGSEKIEIWQIPDGTDQLIPVREEQLINGRHWELFLYADDIF